ncbi:hypothetical protein ACFL06_00140 [Patescibacteria group bacterium]
MEGLKNSFLGKLISKPVVIITVAVIIIGVILFLSFFKTQIPEKEDEKTERYRMLEEMSVPKKSRGTAEKPSEGIIEELSIPKESRGTVEGPTPEQLKALSPK